jgi:hypothetical protein
MYAAAATVTTHCSLVQALETNETLTYLDLSNNVLDDDKVRLLLRVPTRSATMPGEKSLACTQPGCMQVRMLASGLLENLSVTHLNVSHRARSCWQLA